jgi:hypothetical protein
MPKSYIVEVEPARPAAGDRPAAGPVYRCAGLRSRGEFQRARRPSSPARRLTRLPLHPAAP